MFSVLTLVAIRTCRISRIPPQERAQGDEVLKMLSQLSRHVTAHEQYTELKIAEEGIVCKISARKQGLFVYNRRLSVELPGFPEQIEFSLVDRPIEDLCFLLQVKRKRFERIM